MFKFALLKISSVHFITKISLLVKKCILYENYWLIYLLKKIDNKPMNHRKIC